MNFTITILFDRRRYTYKVERISVTAREEAYKVIGRNKSVIFINNRPLLKEKRLKHWKITWKMQGDLWNVHFKNLLVEALEKEIVNQQIK